jgi:CelD/BcsL family acetyltransferase involved in cellulose biosynthesis
VGGLAPSGGVRIHRLDVADGPVAMELVLRAGPLLIVHKAAYDERHRRASPGQILWRETIRHACADPTLEAIEGLTHDALGRRWRAKPYVVRRVQLSAPGVRGLLLARGPARLRRVGRWARRALRRLIRR